MSKKAPQKKKAYESDDDHNEEELVNSDDEDMEQSEETDDENQFGGDDSEDNADDHLDVDPDEEAADYNEEDDGEYDPVQQEELADEDAEIENEDEVEDLEQEEFEGEEIEDIGEAEDGAVPTKVCHVKNLNKEIIADGDDSSQYAKLDYVRIADSERITDPILSYYELVRVLGTRAQQFNFGAEPLVNGVTGMHPAKIAYVELIAKMTPFIIRRHLPGKKYEEWKIDELEQIHQVDDDFFVPENLDLSKFSKKKN